MTRAERELIDTLEPDAGIRAIRRFFVLTTLPYPLWHLLAPEGATDPWIAWWLVGATFHGVALASLRIAFVERNLLSCFNVCSALVTLQLFLLAFWNDMDPFYSVGSAIAVISTLASIRRLRNLVAYSGFVLALGALLTVMRPDLAKLAYWGGMLPVCVFFYSRLAMQHDLNRLSREYRKRLEERVAERTGELARANRLLQTEIKERERLEADLRFSQKLEALGRMAGALAHDFNNLLTAISIHADLLMDSLPETSPQRGDVARIRKASEQAAELIRQLLTFARGSGSLTRVADLGDVIRKCSPTLQHLIGEDTRLECDVEARPQPIQASPDEIEQILINLALNARDAMPEGGVFTLETRVLPDGLPSWIPNGDASGSSPHVLLAATDTGTGMDRETRERAFEPFFTRKGTSTGTGLGLSIVYGIVTRAGGRVHVQSEPDQGARFELYWPCVAMPPARAESPSGARFSVPDGARILLVENDGDVRGALARTLRRAGYEVEACPDADRALDLATREPDFQLVVSDIVMPGMSGIELVESLRSLRPQVPTLLISGYLNHPFVRQRDLSPDTNFLPKPFTTGELLRRVRESLEGTASG